MENTKLIDENQYFVESKKAIQIALVKENVLEKQLKTADKLQLVKKHKAETKSSEEYEELEKLEKELERRIRFNQFQEPAVPEDHKEKVKRNAAVEQLAVDEKLNELKLELKGHIEYLENEVMPLITNIGKLESMKKIPDQIDIVVKAEIGETAPFPLRHRLQVLQQTFDGTRAGEAQIALAKVLSELKKIQVPVETKGLLSFLKRGGKK